jgi:hypothetical protein
MIKERVDTRPEGATRGALRHKLGATFISLAAFLSFVISVVLWFTDSRQEALFTGLWVPSILALGAFYAALQGR